ncbi:hypothetical protein B4U45_02110 [Mycobacterium persicum]|uniref:Uncharacterized protein n=1 Tax=Mycobacterium persicum TaxID=1487726 RepID=A0A8E2IZK2_9MYCO|nr:hypothetical protein B4U45_02110 [Mycobacterium persicum]
MALVGAGDTAGAGAGADALGSAIWGTPATPVAIGGAAAIGAVGGAIAGSACVAGVAAAFITPADNDCEPAAAGAPIVMPVATDWPNDCGDS